MQNIFWPDQIRPEKYRVHSYNSIFINTPKELIWRILVDATHWPEWYTNSKNVKLQSGESLNAGTKFEWNTFGLKVYSEVIEYREFESLGWTACEIGGEGYHGWRLIEQDGGILVVTEEVQRGWGVSLLTPLIKRGLQKQHQIWLEKLKGKCELGFGN